MTEKKELEKESRLLKEKLERKSQELKRTRKSLKQRSKELAALFRTSRILSSALSLDRVYRLIVETVSEIMKVEIVSLMLVDKETGCLVIKAALGLGEKIIKETRVRIGEEISGWIAKHGQPLLIKDIEKDPRFRRVSKERYYTKSLLSVPLKAKKRYTTSALLSVPLVVRKGVIGILNVNNKVSGEIFSESDLEVLTILAEQIALAIENLALHEKEKERAKSLEKAQEELEKKVKELEEFHDVAVGRELEMAKLEKEIVKLKEELKKGGQKNEKGEKTKRN